eukprot:GHUV01043102.1.p1 GENE.GHUV01043102.1~~GHUV01043102.1.p1  ORF type:complete len:143 (+),score=17.60 GHUV01043102.1:593-1021(+)
MICTRFQAPLSPHKIRIWFATPIVTVYLACRYMEGYSNYCKLRKGNSCITEGTYTYKRGLSSPESADIDCNYKNKDGVKQSYCLVAGNVLNLLDACDKNEECTSFDYFANTPVGKGGFLKKATDTDNVRMSGSAMYTKATDD